MTYPWVVPTKQSFFWSMEKYIYIGGRLIISERMDEAMQR